MKRVDLDTLRKRLAETVIDEKLRVSVNARFGRAFGWGTEVSKRTAKRTDYALGSNRIEPAMTGFIAAVLMVFTTVVTWSPVPGSVPPS